MSVFLTNFEGPKHINGVRACGSGLAPLHGPQRGAKDEREKARGELSGIAISLLAGALLHVADSYMTREGSAGPLAAA